MRAYRQTDRQTDRQTRDGRGSVFCGPDPTRHIGYRTPPDEFFYFADPTQPKPTRTSTRQTYSKQVSKNICTRRKQATVTIYRHLIAIYIATQTKCTAVIITVIISRLLELK